MSMHYETIRKIVDDALSCESHETLTIYTSVWLSQPDVDDEPYNRLVQVCELYEGSS